MDNTTTEIIPTTTSGLGLPADEGLPQYVGYIATVVTCICFGSCFVPVKKFDAADGVTFQWIQCIAIMAFGVVFNIIIGAPPFEPLAMIGGVMWCTGNLVCVVIVRCVGIGIGMNLWSLVGMVIGWASGRFGFFDDASVPTIEWLQYLGIALSILRGVLAALIKPNVAKDAQPSSTESQPSVEVSFRTRVSSVIGSIRLTNVARKMSEILQGSTSEGAHPYSELDESRQTNNQGQVTINNSSSSRVAIAEEPEVATQKDFVDKMSPIQQKLLGVGLATFAGVNFGFQFATVSVRKAEGGSQSDMDYAFSFYCGTFISSCVYMIIYSLAKRNKPIVNAQLIAPGLLSGAMWALGQTGWFIANSTLSEAITFPLMAAGPALVSLMWSFFVFNEIQGKRNVILLAVVVVITIISVLMVAFSM